MFYPTVAITVDVDTLADLAEYAEDNAMACGSASEIANTVARVMAGAFNSMTSESMVIALTVEQAEEIRDIAAWRTQVNTQELEHGCEDWETKFRRDELRRMTRVVDTIDAMISAVETMR